MPPADPSLAIPLVCLASQSPRRRALLAQIGVAFRHLAVEVDESALADERPEDYVARLALAKARAGRARQQERPPLPVLGADTSVVLGERLLGKPRDAAEARAMLEALSANRHLVMSAVALVDGGREAVRTRISTVTFRALDAAEIAAYVASGEPLDKAGAYGIQGIAGAFVSELRGSYSGVMGLPLAETTELLEAFGVPWLVRPGAA